MEAWCEKAVNLRLPAAGEAFDDLFLFEVQRLVNNDATVSLFHHRYEVSGVLIGLKVTLRYDPSALGIKPIKVRYDGRDYDAGQPIDPVRNARSRRARKASRMKFKKTPEPS